MTEPSERVAHARALLHSQRHGVLATIGLDLPGYPFGSVVPYALDDAGEVLILVSRLAQHTKNMQADPRVSLTVHDATQPDPQAAPRLTWVADAGPVPAEDTAAYARYLATFPEARAYLELDFTLYRLKLVKARYIEGFARIFWVTRDELVQQEPA